ncbi:MAG: twin-arginine translocase TatA/TatE family subunit [Thermoplasmatota archaeon]
MFGSMGIQELLIIAGVALLVFGPSRLPKMGKAFGETIREFRKVGKDLAEAGDEVDRELKAVEKEVRS